MNFWDRVILVSGGHHSAWAAQLGIPKTTVSAWKRGSRGPLPETLADLVEKTGIPAEWWLRGEGEIPPDAARRFGLAAGGTGNAPQGVDQPAAPARRRLPPVLDGVPDEPAPATPPAGPRHRYEALFLLLMRLWISGRAEWLPAGLSLAQASLLADRATARFTEFVGRQPTSSAPEGLELELSVNCLEWAWGALAREGFAASPAADQRPAADAAGSS